MKRSAPARVAVTLLFLSLATGSCAAARTVAIGDIHGAYDQFVAILQTAGLVDKDLSWTGGKSILVQTGDEVDRGPRSRGAMDLLMGLMEKASAQGGEVRPLLGNHETMVMMGDLRYVTAEGYAEFAAPDSAKRCESEFQHYVQYRAERAGRFKQPPPQVDKQAWLAAHPPGYFEYRDALAPSGKYGAWLRQRDAITQVGDVLFLHGGLSPASPLKSVNQINETVRREIKELDDLWARLSKKGVLWPYLNIEEAQKEAKAEWDAGGGNGNGDVQTFLNLGALNIISPDGPLWYRGFSMDPESMLAPELDKILKHFKVHYVVVGHTIPNSRRITPRFDGHVFLIDTGMLVSWFQGRPSALEINDDHFQALYVGEAPQALAAGGSGKGK